MRTIKFLLDTAFYTNKPTNAGSIQTRMRDDVCRAEGTPQEMLQACLEGYTIKPAFYEVGGVKKEHFKSTDVIAFDVDDASVTIADTIEKSKKYHLPLIGIYKTFSHTDEHQKHRGLLLLPCTITDYREYELLMVMVQQIFNGDGQATDAARLFYGAKEGSEPIHTNYEECVNIENLLASFYEEMKVKSGTDNYSRNLKNVASKVSLDVIGGMLDLQVENGALKTNFKVENFQHSKAGKLRKVYNPANMPITGYGNEECDFKEKLMGNCRLFTEFANGTYWVNHNEILFLTSNLHRFKGGIEFIKQTMRDNPQYYNDSLLTIGAYMGKVNGCLSQVINYEHVSNCSKFCDHCENCSVSKKYKNLYEYLKSYKTNVITPIYPVVYTKERLTLHVIEQKTKDAFMHIMDEVLNSNSGVWVLKAPTGVGKTEILLQYDWSEMTGRVAFATPTHRLKNEFVNRGEQAGVYFWSKPERPVIKNKDTEQQVQDYYSRKQYKSARLLYMREYQNGSKDNEEYRAFLSDLHNTQSQTLVATTHQDILLNGGDGYNFIIFDEDVLLNSMSKDRMTIDDFNKVVNHLYSKLPDSQITALLKTFMDGTDCKLFLQGLEPSKEEESEILTLINIESSLDFLGMYTAEYLYRDKMYVHYGRRLQLPNKPVVILSATANEGVYKRLYGDSLRFIDVGLVGDGGKLVQYLDNTYSRKQLTHERTDIQDIVQDVLNVITEAGGEITDSGEYNFKVLTYASKTSKTVAQALGNNLVKVHDNIYFGNSCGYDSLNGKNLVILGTPNISDSDIKLYGLLLFGEGVDVNSIFEGRTKKEVNGFNLRYASFEEPTLKMVQSYIIESELLQIIGRARLSRNKNTHVLLMSRYPLYESDILHYGENTIIKSIGGWGVNE